MPMGMFSRQRPAEMISAGRRLVNYFALARS